MTLEELQAKVSLRALGDKGGPDLWLIPDGLAHLDEVPLADGRVLVRKRGAIYDFHPAPFIRTDGDACPEVPGSIFVVGKAHVPLSEPDETTTERQESEEVHWTKAKNYQ